MNGQSRPFLVLALFTLAGCVTAAPAEDLPRRDPVPASGSTTTTAASTSSGATASYTAAQAERGRTTFNSICSACHGLAEFRGRMFELSWMDRPVGDFFAHISTAMPQDNPGSLSPAQYAGVVAYVLQLNGVPARSSEVPTDAAALSGIRWR